MYHKLSVAKVGRKIWDWFKEAGNLISLSFLVFVLIFFFRFAVTGQLFGGSIDSARFLLSALAQTQGAIVAIVISLTIVAVQVSSFSQESKSTGKSAFQAAVDKCLNEFKAENTIAGIFLSTKGGETRLDKFVEDLSSM